MKAVVLNGIDNEYGNLIFAYNILIQELNQIGWKFDTYFLYEKEIENCKGCFGCWVQTPGSCLTKDNTESILRNIINSDTLILLTNITFGGYSSHLKKLMDRFLPLVNPFLVRRSGRTSHLPRYKIYPSIAGIGVMISPDEEAEKVFKELIYRNSLHLFAPKHASTILFAGQPKEKNQQKINYLLQSIGT
jgi:multimeric flavodoxin WrbA